MTAADYVSVFGSLFLVQIPTFVISSLGLWFSVARREALGRASNWAFWGFLALIAYTLFGAVLRMTLIGFRSNQLLEVGSEEAMSFATLNAWSLAAYPLFITGLGLIARAVFLERSSTLAQNRLVGAA